MPWDLPTVWFVAIAVLWTGYQVLEGFDFGVGMLLPVVGRDEPGRRVLLGAIGPVWDGNEVWLITAIGAMFAAFPAWYAGVLSGFYLPVLGRRDDVDRRVLINTIGPVWDMNETWLIVAGASLSRRSPTGTRRCSAASTCRCC